MVVHPDCVPGRYVSEAAIAEQGCGPALRDISARDTPFLQHGFRTIRYSCSHSAFSTSGTAAKECCQHWLLATGAGREHLKLYMQAGLARWLSGELQDAEQARSQLAA